MRISAFRLTARKTGIIATFNIVLTLLAAENDGEQKNLLVDDDEMIRVIAKQSLETNGGFDVTVVASGEECLEVAGEIMPNLILMDVFMPGLDGPSAFQELRKNKVLTHIPVVFLTANTSEQDAERLMGMGAAGVMAKPFQPSELSSQIRQFLPNSSL